MDHETVVEEWRRSAQLHDDENYEFLRTLKFRDYGFDTYELAAELHERAFQIANNALKCPAVFWIVEEMKKRCEARKRKKNRRRRL